MNERLGRAEVIGRIDAFLGCHIDLEELCEWVASYDWDEGAGTRDRDAEQAISRLELYLHEYGDRNISLEELRTIVSQIKTELGSGRAA